ncbi:MAG TPA: MBL fold metallo-hydrolase [Acidobacteriota bacterium]|nr:MBL fold metallo-hydrolase [Acidobacteriota bacterium]
MSAQGLHPKTISSLVLARIAVGALLALLVTSSVSAQVTITHLGNEGFLLEGGGKKVLVDALYDGLRGYVTPPPDLRNRLLAAEDGFADVDLVLATHHHDDHFSPDPVNYYLEANSKAEFLSTPQAVARLGLDSADGLLQRVRGVLPEEGKIEERTLNGVRVQILNLHHGRNRNPQVQNLGFIIHLGGRRVLHIGDTMATVEDWAPLEMEAQPVDVALVPAWYMTFPAFIEVIREQLQPKHIAAMHVADKHAPEAYFGRYESQAKQIATLKRIFPSAQVFTKPGQSHRY